jgi:uncharacterized protein (DUF1697 family)
MPAIISMLRGVNVGGHNMIRMEALRALYVSLKLRDPQTYVQSGNVVFQAEGRDLVKLADQIEIEIERSAGFRPSVILRTAAEMREVVARNPFAGRSGIAPNKLAVIFLARDPGQDARDRLLAIKTDPEELRIGGRELYVYYPDGMGRSKFSAAVMERALQVAGTARNWNSVTKLLEMAEKMQAAR